MVIKIGTVDGNCVINAEYTYNFDYDDNRHLFQDIIIARNSSKIECIWLKLSDSENIQLGICNLILLSNAKFVEIYMFDGKDVIYDSTVEEFRLQRIQIKRKILVLVVTLIRM